MVAVTLVNESCSPQWEEFPRTGGGGHFAVHTTAKTLLECQQACLFNPQCGKVVWYPAGPNCYMYTSEIRLIHKFPSEFTKYKLLKRCDIIPGLYFTDTLSTTYLFSVTRSFVISDYCLLDVTIILYYCALVRFIM